MQNIHFKRSLVIFFIFSFFSHSIFSWNALGHMVITDIAYQHLNPSARKNVDNLVVYFSKEYPYVSSLLQMSTWPDAIRAQKIDTFTRWHYIDVPFSADKTALKNTISSDNATWAVDTIKHVLLNPNANQYERARFLAFMVHIVGDMHQPLHTVTRISNLYPDGDRGGNLFKVKFNGKKINLHKLWDDGLGFLKDDASLKNASVLSATLRNLYPPSYFGTKAQEINLSVWEKEGMKNATQYVYDTKENEGTSATYVTEGKEVVQKELTLAGYRLATLLNQMLG